MSDSGSGKKEEGLPQELHDFVDRQVEAERRRKDEILAAGRRGRPVAPTSPTVPEEEFAKWQAHGRTTQGSNFFDE